MSKKNITLAFYSLLIAGIYYLTLGDNIRYALMFFVSFGFAKFFFYVMDRMKIKKKYYIPVIIALWLNCIGEMFFYYNFEYYDKILHFFIPMLITAILVSKSKEPFDILVKVTGMLILFEIFEIILYTFLGLNTLGVIIGGNFTMSPVDDTITDVLLGIAGSYVYLLLNRKVFK